MSHPSSGTPTSPPDSSSLGFVAERVNPLRYDGQPNEPDEVVGVLSAMIPQGSRVLDVGCGTGSVSLHLIANRGVTIVGVEPDEERAARARERGIDVRCELLSESLIKTLGGFDVVLFADVLEHLAEPAAVLGLAKTALVRGGRVVASVPNVAHWSVRFELLRGRFDYREWGIMDATHLRWFTEVTLRNLFHSAGISIEEQRVTAGVDLQCYIERMPWRRFQRATRAAFLGRAIRRWPLLFGCQLVVRSAPVIAIASE